MKKPFYKRIWFWVIIIILVFYGNDEKKQSGEVDSGNQELIEETAPENHVSKEYVRWFAKKYNLKINDFKSERVKVDALVEDVDFSQGVRVEQSILSKRYERTQEGNILYIGDMKDNKPDGYGILYERVYACLEDGFLKISDTGRVGENEYGVYTPIYAGEFRDGKFDGFGYKYMTAKEMAKNVVEVYDEPYFFIKPTKEILGTYEEIQKVVIDEVSPCIYEGFFSKGKYNGKGNEYVYGITAYYGGLSKDELLDGVCTEQQYQEIFDSQDLENSNEESQIGMIMGIMHTTPNLDYLNILSGTYKNGKANGEFHIYGNDYLIYEGNIKNDSRNGKGISYFYGTKQIEYDGQWRKGEYHGNGTLYRRDGSIEYDGEWANGDYAT